jgi:MFS family permease
MLLVEPLILQTGVGNSVNASVLVPLFSLIIKETTDPVWDGDKTNHYCLLALVGLGIGEVVGALLFGKIEDNFSGKISTTFCLAMTSFSCLLCILYTLYFDFTLWMSALLCAFWGLQDGASNCLTSCICGF